MNIQPRKLAAAALLLISLHANAALCPPFDETSVLANLTAIEVAFKLVMRGVFSALSSTLLSFDKQELSASRVLTSQVATSAKAQINSSVTLMQAKMKAIGSLESSKQQLRVYQDYSVLTGQGVDPCGQLAAQTAVSAADARTVFAAAAAVAKAPSAPGRYGNAEGFTERGLRLRQDNFATPDEEKLGYGRATSAVVLTANGSKFPLAGADTNANVLFADTADPRVQLAKDGFISHIGGVPATPITKELADLPAGKSYLLAKAEKDAAMSAALNSLAMVAAENTPLNGADSKAQAVRKLVGQYYGQDASNRWKGWASQSRRGVLVDQLKLDAALLAMKSDQYAAGQRLEVLLATTVVSDAKQQFRPALDASIQSLENLRARPSVR